MGLPTLAIQTSECTLPESGRKVKFRPFVVKEEKILMLAASNKDAESFSEVFIQITNILRACTFDKFRIDKLSSIDFEYLFIKIKVASKGSIESQSYKCKREITSDDISVGAEDCNTTLNLDVDFDKIKLNGEMPDRVIKVQDDLVVTLHIPTLDIIMRLQEAELDEIELLSCCLESVLYKGEVSSEFDLNEAETFIESLNESQLEPLVEYFRKVPSLTYKTIIRCPKCKHDHKFELEGLQSFFG